MTIHLYDMLDQHLLEQMLETRMVKAQRHPDGLTVFNYTSHAQFERTWNDVTRACRGLIVDGDLNVVARPFIKFFNVDEHADELPAGPVQVTDKLDGSLGILYPLHGSYRIATRGSFASQQALHGSARWQERYEDHFVPNPRWTYLFEIIAPHNRIVLDYGDLDDLVLLGAVDIESGRSVPLRDAAERWPGPIVEELPYATVEEALAAPSRANREGVVIHFVEPDLRLKLKQEDYVRLHRLVTGVSERRIWEALSAGQDLEPWLDAVPDEFYSFVSTTRDELLDGHARLAAEARRRFAELATSLPADQTRRDFAAAVTAMNWPLASTMFALLDGKSIDAALWKALRPDEHVPLFSRGEDVS